MLIVLLLLIRAFADFVVSFLLQLLWFRFLPIKRWPVKNSILLFNQAAREHILMRLFILEGLLQVFKIQLVLLHQFVTLPLEISLGLRPPPLLRGDIIAVINASDLFGRHLHMLLQYALSLFHDQPSESRNCIMRFLVKLLLCLMLLEHISAHQVITLLVAFGKPVPPFLAVIRR